MSYGKINYEANRAWRARTQQQLPRSTKELKRSPIKPVSKKLKTELAAYSPLYAEFLQTWPDCWHCLELGVARPRRATEVHHVCGRDGFYLTERRLYMPVAGWCHRIAPDAIENSNKVAFARGWKISRHLTLEEQLAELERLRGRFPWVKEELERE